MATVKMKPTSPGRRGRVRNRHDHLWKGEPYAPLLEPQKSSGGRNNAGRTTTRHRGGGHKHHYRRIDFKRDKDGVRGVVERIEYDPNRSAHIALVKYLDGDRRYIRSTDRKSTRLNSSHVAISYAVFCLKKKNRTVMTH